MQSPSAVKQFGTSVMLSYSSLPPAVRPITIVSPTSVELPKIKILSETGTRPQKTSLDCEATSRRFLVVPPVPVRTDFQDGAAISIPHGHAMCSPVSPASIFTQPETFGLSPLLEAAEHMRLSSTDTFPLHYNRSSPLKRDLQQLQTLPSIMHSMGGYPLEISAMSKRACIRSDDGLHMQASCSLLSCMPRQGIAHPSSIAPQPQQQNIRPTHIIQSHHTAVLNTSGPHEQPKLLGSSVWDTVLSTCSFPQDICFSENGTSSVISHYPDEFRSKYEDTTDAAGVTVELNQDQLSDCEGGHVNALIQALQKADRMLPPEVSLQKSDNDNLKSPAKSICKKARLPSGSTHHLQNDLFDALSLRSIMNNEPCASLTSSMPNTIANSNLRHQSSASSMICQKQRVTQRVLKRSDYSQHCKVRSGRWSVEEENYAKAMIEAFKAGYLPLHGNVSLRKFMSEILVCHPMRISKKFVGYVRKYHWYRVAAGKCDPVVKAQALCQLSHLERVFWTSQQNCEWSTSLRRDE